ncbi:hypothetical protein ACVMB0_001680 [Bradyrhizobium sp. USDA 4451]
MIMLAAAPISATQRQPSMPWGESGTSHHDSATTIGTADSITAWLIANARPRIQLGTSSVM